MREDLDTSSHRELLKQLIGRLEESELPWYEGQVSRAITFWRAFAVISLMLSLAASAVAAFMEINVFDSYGRYVLVILPILSSGVAGLSQLFRFRETEALRENGRIELQDAILNAKGHFVDATSSGDFRAAYHAVRERFHALEIAQHHGYVALYSEPAPQPRPTQPEVMTESA